MVLEVVSSISRLFPREPWSEEMIQLYEDKKCFNCKQTGHVSRYCKAERIVANDQPEDMRASRYLQKSNLLVSKHHKLKTSKIRNRRNTNKLILNETTTLSHPLEKMDRLRRQIPLNRYVHSLAVLRHTFHLPLRCLTVSFLSWCFILRCSVCTHLPALCLFLFGSCVSMPA
jgi:hypothetical protein